MNKKVIGLLLVMAAGAIQVAKTEEEEVTNAEVMLEIKKNRLWHKNLKKKSDAIQHRLSVMHDALVVLVDKLVPKKAALVRRGPDEANTTFVKTLMDAQNLPQ